MNSGLLLKNSYSMKHFLDLLPAYYIIKYPSSQEYLVYCEEPVQIKNDEKDQEDQTSQIHYISEQKLFELLTSHEYQDSEIFNTVLYGYYFFISQKDLFKNLIERFRLNPPLNLSNGENSMFLKKILKTVQIKVLIFLQHWFRNHKNSLIISDFEVEEMFFECLFAIFNSNYCGKWLEDPISRFFDELEEVFSIRNKRHFRKNKLFTSFLENFLKKGYFLIRYKKKELAQCLCLFDQGNFEKISIFELIHRNHRNENTLNYYKFIDSFNFLSKFITFILLSIRQNFSRIEFFEDCIDLVEELKKLNNFHSSYAIYLGFTYPAILRLNPILENKLSKNYKNKLERLTNFYEKPQIFREFQTKCVLPCVPALSFYTRELTQVEEMFKMQENNEKYEKMIDFLKISRLAGIVKKIELFRTCPYNFSKKYNEDFIRDFYYLPNIDEDTLYDMSKSIY